MFYTSINILILGYTGCEDRFGDFTWSEAVAECGDMLSAILPDQSLCQTVTNHNSYWLGLYRSKGNFFLRMIFAEICMRKYETNGENNHL